jgi:hypothetical protein
MFCCCQEWARHQALLDWASYTHIPEVFALSHTSEINAFVHHGTSLVLYSTEHDAR